MGFSDQGLASTAEFVKTLIGLLGVIFDRITGLTGSFGLKNQPICHTILFIS